MSGTISIRTPLASVLEHCTHEVAVDALRARHVPVGRASRFARLLALDRGTLVPLNVPILSSFSLMPGDIVSVKTYVALDENGVWCSFYIS